ncbi:fimbrillin family protein [Bacteroides sp. 214]|uniref:fimbrillin family protein n=1 Tax=Bacteroides sp. 214 TaxID=2302935 RepID=UPI0013D8B23E|nr:fimbrillin family protein [Bacteroides sp. 214]
MKQKIFLGLSFLATIGLWTGCSNDEVIDLVNETRAVSFHVQGGTPEVTRTTGTTSSSIEAFVVYGIDDVAVEAEGDTKKNIFNGVTVARQTGGSFDYNPKRYYNTGAKEANFVAYSPVGTTSKSPVVTNLFTGASFTHTVSAPNADGKTVQEDFLVAGETYTTIANKVRFNFKHALARVFVKAVNSMPEVVVIEKLILKNLYPTGTIAGTPTAPETDATTAQWGWTWTPGDTDKIDYPYILAATGVAVPVGTSTATLVTSMEQGMMVIPHTTEQLAANENGGKFALEVTYSIGNLDSQTVSVALGDSDKFEMGKQYAIKITFNALTAISFEVEVTDFGKDITDVPTA